MTKISVREKSRSTSEKVSASHPKSGPVPKVVRPHEIPLEDCGQARTKDLVKAVGPALSTLEASIHILPPGGRLEPHRHVAEEIIYVLEGSGYDLHWETPHPAWPGDNMEDLGEPSRYNWSHGDTIYVPANVLHQHCNRDVIVPARIISARSRIPECPGFDQMGE